MTEKVKEMLRSNDSELKTLAMNILKSEDPAIWCAILNYSGINTNENAVINQIESQGNILNIGHSIRYRGIPDAPPMIITDVRVGQIVSSDKKTFVYYTEIHAKYWNKSTQSFVKVSDRLECFEIVNKKINYDESATTDIAIAANATRKYS